MTQRYVKKNENQKGIFHEMGDAIFFDTKGSSLDTLAQLGKNIVETPLKLENLKKRARAKYAQTNIVKSLTEYAKQNKLPLEQSYRNTLYCCQKIEQNGQELRGKYCANRWCLVCNRIRTGKLLNKYEMHLNELSEKYFVTLTIPNVKANELKESIKEMQRVFKQISEVFKKGKTPIIGLRKIECTYNVRRDDYHPHLHIVLSGEALANQLVVEWLDRFPEASLKGQDVRPADQHSCKELFKYFTKLLANDKRIMKPEALNTMFEAMIGLRVFQTLGNFGKPIKDVGNSDINVDVDVDDSIKDIHVETYPELPNDVTLWEWVKHDWVDIINRDGRNKVLTGYVPSEAIEAFSNLIETNFINTE